jgi:hypothetical protein
MPNRILRDWTDSDRVNSLTAEAERFFTRLIMKVDDFGRYSADGRRLKAFLFPLKDSLRETDCSRWLAECEKAGLIRFYDAAGKRYLEIANFRQRLRIMKEAHPKPPDADAAPPDGAVPVMRPSDDGHVPDRRPLRNESKRIEENQNQKRSEANGYEGTGALRLLETGLNEAYQRTAGSPWTYAEQAQLAELARRPEILAEWETLLAYRRRLPANEKRFFPNSIGSLMAKWTDVLDKAHISRPEPIRSTPPPALTGPRITDDQRARMAALLVETKRRL